MITPPSITFITEFEDPAIRLFNFWADRGFVLDIAFVTRRFWLFGKIKYHVRMYAGYKGYKYLIDEAIRLEKYEEAGRLTKELNELYKLKVKQ